MTHITELRPAGDIPAWTLGWRLRRALAHSDLTVIAMAERLGLSDSTLSRWMADEYVPKIGMLRQWASETGVSYVWLTTGNGEPDEADTLGVASSTCRILTFGTPDLSVAHAA